MLQNSFYKTHSTDFGISCTRQWIVLSDGKTPNKNKYSLTTSQTAAPQSHFHQKP
jgi:hypothetical protein